MNAFVKNFVKIAFLSIVIGIFLIMIGYSMNKSVFDNIVYGGYSIFGRNQDWSELEESGFYNDKNSINQTINNSDLVYPKDKDTINSLDINIVAGTVRIVEGDEFNIQVNDIGSERITSEISDGVWTIEDRGADTSNYGISVFGINISTDSITNNISSVKITIPRDFKGKNINLKCGAGSITADKLTADEVTILVGAGSCRIDELTAKEKSSYTVGAGELRIHNMSAYNATIDCSMGSIFAEGTLYGNNIVSCSMGTIDLKLEGQQNDYNYDGKCSMGTVTINGSSYSGLNQSFVKNNGADNAFSINCNVGTINLRISD